MSKKQKDTVTLDEVQAIGRGEGAPPDQQAPAPAVSNGKPKESSAARFRRLAETRVQKALDRIAQLVPLANPAQYEYTPQEAALVVGALTEAVVRVGRAFQGAKRERQTFRLVPNGQDSPAQATDSAAQ